MKKWCDYEKLDRGKTVVIEGYGTCELGSRVVDYPAELCSSTPPAQALVQVQHADVGKVGHPGHCLQEPESLNGAFVVDDIHDPAN